MIVIVVTYDYKLRIGEASGTHVIAIRGSAKNKSEKEISFCMYRVLLKSKMLLYAIVIYIKGAHVTGRGRI